METIKMTLAKAQDFVRDTKYIVWSEEESKQLQEKLFELGCKWVEEEGQKVRYTEHPFLFVSNKLLITYLEKGDYDKFNAKSNRYKKIDDVLNIEITEPKPKFAPNTLKPFDKVLVRDTEDEYWQCDLFSHITTNGLYSFYCVGSYYRYCIPYNNDTKHLLGTNDEAPEFYQLD